MSAAGDGQGAPDQPADAGEAGNAAQPEVQPEVLSADTTWADSPPAVAVTGPAVIPAPLAQARRRSRWRLWITLGAALALLLALVGGGLYADEQYRGPAVAAGRFCGDLKTQNYPAAYALLDRSLRSQFTQEQFTEGARQLDRIEGTVRACAGASGGAAYQYSLGSGTAAATVTITRVTAGTLSGVVHLKHEDGVWKVDELDTSLLGVNLGALKTVGAFCVALENQDYATAYGLLGARPQAVASEADFILAGQTHDLVDGRVTACGFVGLGQDNSDTDASLVVSVVRGKLGARQGAVTLDVEQGAWKMTALGVALQGTDIGALAVGAAFCTYLVAGDVAAAYQNVVANAIKEVVTQAQFVATFQLGAGESYRGCAPEYASYVIHLVNGRSVATYDATISVALGNGSTAEVPASFYFVLEEGAWKFDGMTFKPV